ncbi:hypothetical protein D3C76_1476630 [compost metagenome]
MSNLAQALASQAQDSIKQADTLLFTLVDRLEHEGVDQSRLPRLLSAQRSELSQLHGLFVFDETGRWLANSNGVCSIAIIQAEGRTSGRRSRAVRAASGSCRCRDGSIIRTAASPGWRWRRSI